MSMEISSITYKISYLIYDILYAMLRYLLMCYATISYSYKISYIIYQISYLLCKISNKKYKISVLHNE